MQKQIVFFRFQEAFIFMIGWPLVIFIMVFTSVFCHLWLQRLCQDLTIEGGFQISSVSIFVSTTMVRQDRKDKPAIVAVRLNLKHCCLCILGKFGKYSIVFRQILLHHIYVLEERQIYGLWAPQRTRSNKWCFSAMYYRYYTPHETINFSKIFDQVEIENYSKTIIFSVLKSGYEKVFNEIVHRTILLHILRYILHCFRNLHWKQLCPVQ